MQLDKDLNDAVGLNRTEDKHSTPKKSFFIEGLVTAKPDITFKEVIQAWSDAGYSGSISSTSVRAAKRRMGATQLGGKSSIPTKISFLDKLVVENPDITLQQVIEAWNAAGYPGTIGQPSMSKSKRRMGVAKPRATRKDKVKNEVEAQAPDSSPSDVPPVIQEVIVPVPVPEVVKVPVVGPLKVHLNGEQLSSPVLPSLGGNLVFSKDSKPVFEAPITLVIPSGIDRDVVLWLNETYNKYRKWANKKGVCGTTWSHRLMQLSCGLELMTRGVEGVKKYFEAASGAVFGLLGAAKTIPELDSVPEIMDHLVYFDLLEEIAQFQSKNGLVSKHIQDYYDDRFCVLHY